MGLINLPLLGKLQEKMPSNFEIDITLGPTETTFVDLTPSTPTFNALTGPGLKGDPGQDGIDGVDGADGDRGPKGDPGETYITVTKIIPSEIQDGARINFPLDDIATSAATIQVFRNGLMETNGLGYTATTTHVTFTTAPLDNDTIAVVYEKVR